jgi:hypothetical protein
MRAPEERYASALELEQALAFQLARHYPSFTPEALAQVVRARSGAAPVEDAATTTPAHPDAQPLASLTQRGVMVTQFSRVSSQSERAPRPGTKAVEHGHTRIRRLRWLAGVAVVAVVGAFALVPILRAARPTPAVAPPAPASSPPPAENKLAVPVVAPAPMPAPATPNAMRENAPARAKKTHTLSAHATPAHPPEPGHAAVGYLSVDSTPWGQVFVDGHRIASETPIYRVAIPAGPHRVSVLDPSTKHFSAEKRIVIVPGQNGVLGFHP